MILFGFIFDAINEKNIYVKIQLGLNDTLHAPDENFVSHSKRN